jgi:hypothetical protein
MKRIVIVLTAMSAVVSIPDGEAFQTFSAAPEAPDVKCWIEQIHYNANWYNANGKCQEFNKRTDSQGRDANNGVLVPFSAVGRYDPATHGTFESIRIVKGGLDIPTHYYYGTLETQLSCPLDPWLQKTTSCQLERVTTTDTIPSYYVDGLVRQRGRPFTSDMSDAQRAGLNREYQAAGHRLNEMVKVPADGPSGRTALQQAISTPLQVVSPPPGASMLQSDVRVQVRAPISITPAQAMDVELSWLPPRPTGAGDHTQPPVVRVKTWQAPLDRLTQGVVLPRDVTSAWLGPTLVRVRVAGAKPGAWSEGVSFTLTSNAGQAVRTPASATSIPGAARPTPSWATASQDAAAQVKTQGTAPTARAVQPPPAGFGAAQAPASSLGSRP